MRQLVLDTETTGLEPSEGHRVIEIGCVELINRRPTGNNYHQYINPEREIDAAAIEIHGITNESLADKPRFADIAEDFLAYVTGAELIIHNAPFDVGFLNHEFGLIASGNGCTTRRIDEACTVIDSLVMARRMHPGQKNDLDSLCKRYSIDNSQRSLHGALLDAEILADVYLAMTGGQTGLFEDMRAAIQVQAETEIRRADPNRPRLPIIAPSADELAAHASWLDEIDKRSKGCCLWKTLPDA
ncbi:MAG: DNA polymerase III subunit epsilon [Pseudomonadota bacterium]|nr:MAG: DNA polymerase III subunit epsilon [Pseudomonadota bacterium]